MKKLMILGGLTGFVIGVGFGLVKGVTWPALLFRASVATLLAGLLMRWWGRLWIVHLRDSLSQQSAAGAARPVAGAGPGK